VSRQRFHARTHETLAELNQLPVTHIAADKRRDRLVYIRISEEEFQQIQQACNSMGARSVSDLVRTALHRYLNSARPASDTQVADLFSSIGEALQDINRSIQQLMAETSRQSSSDQ
jgi:methyl-accepting chemotaxis protein